MALEGQASNFTCGPASLRIARTLLGGGLQHDNSEIHEDDVRRKSGLARYEVMIGGTSEFAMKRAGRSMGLNVKIRDYVRRDPKRVVRDMRMATAKGHPCVACVHGDSDPYFHWVCIGGFSGEWAIVLDPAMTDWWLSEWTFWPADPSHELTPALMKVSRLLEWIDPGDEMADQVVADYGTSHQFLEVAVAPGHGHRFVRGSITETMVRGMRRDLTIASDFDQIIQDLKETFSFSYGPMPVGVVPAGRFLRSHVEKLVQLVRERVMADACNAATVRQQIRRLMLVADGYQFFVKPGHEGSVLANLAFHLGWSACRVAYGLEDRAA